MDIGGDVVHGNYLLHLSTSRWICRSDKESEVIGTFIITSQMFVSRSVSSNKPHKKVYFLADVVWPEAMGDDTRILVYSTVNSQTVSHFTTNQEIVRDKWNLTPKPPRHGRRTPYNRGPYNKTPDLTRANLNTRWNPSYAMQCNVRNWPSPLLTARKCVLFPWTSIAPVYLLRLVLAESCK